MAMRNHQLVTPWTSESTPKRPFQTARNALGVVGYQIVSMFLVAYQVLWRRFFGELHLIGFWYMGKNGWKSWENHGKLMEKSWNITMSKSQFTLLRDFPRAMFDYREVAWKLGWKKKKKLARLGTCPWWLVREIIRLCLNIDPKIQNPRVDDFFPHEMAV